MNRTLRTLPAYFMLITANALPVYGALIGKLVFFQVIYLYWFESLLLIAFDCIRVAAAQGTEVNGGVFTKLALAGNQPDPEVTGFGPKLSLVLRMIIVRVAILLFYLMFIVAFIGFKVTGEAHRLDVAMTMALKNPFFNTAVIIFLINMLVQLLGGFFISGNFRRDSPRMFASLFDTRTIIMHVMIVGSVFIHQFFFEKTSYASLGEVVYVGLFMLIKTVIDVRHLRTRFKAAPEEAAMI